MTSVKVAKLKVQSKKKPKTVNISVIRDSDGRIKEIYTVNAKSPTFADDLTYVYRTNVRRARDENKKMFGSAEGTRSIRGSSLKAINSNARRKK